MGESLFSLSQGESGKSAEKGKAVDKDIEISCFPVLCSFIKTVLLRLLSVLGVLPRFSSSVPESVQRRVRVKHSPAGPG